MIAKVGVSAAVAALVGVGGMAFGAQVQGTADTTARATAPSVAIPEDPTPAPPSLPSSNAHVPEGTLTVHGTGDASAALPVAPPALPGLPKTPALHSGTEAADSTGLKSPETGGSAKLGAEATSTSTSTSTGNASVKVQTTTNSSAGASTDTDQNDHRDDSTGDGSGDGSSVSLTGSVTLHLGG